MNYGLQVMGHTKWLAAKANTSSATLPLRIRVGDCVLVFTDANSTYSTGVTDNGVGGSNTYTQVGLGTLSTNCWGYENVWCCLSATKTASVVTMAGATGNGFTGGAFPGITAIGAIHQTAVNPGVSGPQTMSDSVTTTKDNSLVVASGLFGEGSNPIATSSKIVTATIANGLFLFLQTVPTSGTVATSSCTYTNGPTYHRWCVMSVELKR